MYYRVALISAIAMTFAASLEANRRLDGSAAPAPKASESCRRIVSVAPSITETLYALGLGPRVAGVTRYCAYPPEVRQKPHIGGYYDPNFEAVVALRPDLVVMLDDHERSLPGFRQLGMNTLVVSHRTVEGIVDSFRAIGAACGRTNEGRRLAREYENRLARLRDRTEGRLRPRVLLALDRTFGQGRLADIYVAGVDGYFDRIIHWAGGQNAFSGRGVRNPVVSSEGVAWLNPDVIVDLAPGKLVEQLGREAIAADWNELQRVEAVRHGRVYVIDQDYALVPGPRFIRLVEDLAALLHPGDGKP